MPKPRPQTMSISPRERFTALIIYASAEITLIAAALLLFFVYYYGKGITMAAFTLLLMLAGSLLIRRSLQIAQIVLMLCIVVVEVIVLLNLNFDFPYVGRVPAGAGAVGFIAFDILVLYLILQNSSLPEER